MQSDLEYITLTDLKARGWTRHSIDTLLGKPDIIDNNPFFKSSPKMRLYDIRKVIKLEKTENFKSLKCTYCKICNKPIFSNYNKVVCSNKCKRINENNTFKEKYKNDPEFRKKVQTNRKNRKSKRLKTHTII